MATADDRSEHIGTLIWSEVLRLARGAAYVLGVLLLVVLTMRVLPLTIQAYVAVVVVWGGACAVGFLFAVLWRRRLFAFVLACAVAPTFIYLADHLVPRQVHALDALAYVFGSLYGIAAGAAGVLISFAVPRKGEVK